MSRTYKTVLIAVLLLGLVAAFAVPVMAADGDNMKVGRVNGAKGFQTSLYSTNPTATLTVVNNRGSGGSPALNLQVKGGPALAVNTKGWVANLNADYVDGRGVNRLQVLRGECHSADVPDGADWSCDAGTFHAPTSGLLMASGSIGLEYGGVADQVKCGLQVATSDGRWTAPGNRDVTVNVNNHWTECATDTVRQISAGSDVNLDFFVSDVDSTTVLDEAAAWWIFVPD